MDRIASQMGSHQNGLDGQLQVHIPMTSIPSALQSNAEHRRTKNRLSQRKRREQLRQKKKSLENTGEEQLQNGDERPAALPQADSQILGLPWPTTNSPLQDDEIDPVVAHKPIEPTSFSTIKSYNSSADDLLYRHHKTPADISSTNKASSTASTEGLFSPSGADFSTLHIDNIFEIEYLNNFLFNSELISPIEQTSTSGSPDEGYLKTLKTGRRRRSSTQSDSLASTESILDNEWDYTAFVEKEANFDEAIMDPTTRIDPDAHGCNKNHIGGPISSDRTLLRLLASLPNNTKAWLSQKIKEDFPDTPNMSVKEEVEILRDMKHLSSHLDNKKRAFVAGMVSHLMQDETTRLLWQRDRELVEKWAPSLWEQLNHIGHSAGIEANNFAQAVCIFLWMLRVLS